MLTHFQEYLDLYTIKPQNNTTNSIWETVERDWNSFDIKAYEYKKTVKQITNKGWADYKKKEYIFYSNTTKSLLRWDIIEKDWQQREIEDVLYSKGGFTKITAISNE